MCGNEWGRYGGRQSIVSANIDDVVVDFLLALPGYEEQIITRAVHCDLGTLRVWVCAPEDLVIQTRADPH